MDTYANREEVQHFSHLASFEEISDNDYNLSVSTYVEAEDTREEVDIVKLNAEVAEIVAREQVLRDEIDKIIAEIEGCGGPVDHSSSEVAEATTGTECRKV